MPTPRMATPTVASLLEACPSLSLASAPDPTQALDTPLRDAFMDSRAACPGSLFVALEGARVDGHDFVDRAVAAGASAVLVSAGRAPEGCPVPVLEAPNTRAVLGHVAAHLYRDPSRALKVIGVTGTNGKTTTTFLLESLLAHAGVRTGTFGTVHYRWNDTILPAPNTTPESVVLHRLMRRMADEGVEVVIMEVSSHALASWRVEGVLFDAAIFTNLSQDHLDFHETMEAYRDAKASLFTDHLLRAAEKHPAALLNVDDPEGARLAKLLHPAIQAVTCSAEGREAALSVTHREVSLSGQRATVRVEDTSHTLTLPMLGAFNLNNALGAAAAARQIGLDWDTIAAGLAYAPQVPGRLERVDAPDPGAHPTVFVDYAHTPDALARALEALRPHTTGTLRVVFGCGGDRDRDKRPMMGRVAADGADHIVLTSDNPRSEDPETILDEIAAGLPPDTPHTRITDRAEAIAATIARAHPDDVILIAGKGHETYQEIAGQRRDFDDRTHARQAFCRG